MKLITGPGGNELYDLSKDPDEKTNLCDAQPAQVQHLREVLRGLLQQYPPIKGSASRASEQDRDALRSLGYIHYGASES
jgi:hypothetical protein